ncbi:MAG: beta-ketoacyl synthase chain length factor [Chitinophagaceae bacterium]
MSTFIRSTSCISPQNTFGNGDFLTDVLEIKGTFLKAIEPDYSVFVDSKLLRRMSHIIKMGVATAQECLNKAEVKTPGAIITGTAYGCLEDTASFLTQMINLNEGLLLPTSFIQSTHNTVAAQIALGLKCHQYNNTFVHNAISFESALQDATMLLQENETENILVGGMDEITETSFGILTRLGLYKRGPVSNLSIFKSNSKGTIGGEGAAFFLLSDKKTKENLTELCLVNTFYKPNNQEDIEQNIRSFLAQRFLRPEDIDLILTGKNGDFENDQVYHKLSLSVFKNIITGNYKHLCGDYPTSSSFALWLASNIIKNGIVPELVLEGNLKSRYLNKILIYNHYQNKHHSLILVSTC